MIKNPIKILIGSINAILYALVTLIFAILILLFGIVIWIIPSQRWRYHGTRMVLKLPVFWADLLNLIIRINNRHKIIIQGDSRLLSTKKWYILISNHLSWIDILILGYVFNNKIPVIKFFMKKQLLWMLPIAGISCWILGYPFMSKHSRQAIRKRPELKRADIEATKKACDKFKKYPTTVMNFVEGSRFTKEKHQRQSSPFRHLLKPSSGGIAIVMNELRDYLSGVINVTIQYDSDSKMTFWKFACNDFNKIIVHFELLSINDELMGNYYKDREYRRRFQQWLNNIWQRKDQLLD